MFPALFDGGEKSFSENLLCFFGYFKGVFAFERKVGSNSQQTDTEDAPANDRTHAGADEEVNNDGCN